MFQIPLIVLFINRIKPLTPQQLFRHERWFIVFAVVLGLIMNPTPNLIDQMFVIVPMILSYQLSIGIIWWHNRKHSRVAQLLNEDIKLRAARQQRVQDLRTSWRTADALATSAETGLVVPEPVKVEPAQAITPHEHPIASYTRRVPQPIQPRTLRSRTIQ
jgi:hypothetical protein